MMVEKIIDDFFNEYKEKFNDIEEKNEIFINVFFISLINNNSLESGLNYYLKKNGRNIKLFRNLSSYRNTPWVKYFLFNIRTWPF